MLYDKRWDKQTETKADPFKLDSLVAWLEKQPAEKPYCYLDHGQCLLGQYFAHHGFCEVAIYSNGVLVHGKGREHVLYPQVFNSIALMSHPRTFGVALGHARRALSVYSKD